MEKYRAIPKGCMTVGQLAKKMNTTVRTLQYYDREGVLSPSGQSEGGRRLYTDRDVVRLHQVQSMKYLGFSLDDIKNRLVSLDTPKQVADALTGQAETLREKIASLSEALQAVEALREETLQMDSVDWGKYAAIVSVLKTNYEDYWFIKHLDSRTLDHVLTRFDEKSGHAMADMWNRVCAEITELQKNGAPPQGPQGQAAAKSFWEYVMEFTGGDMALLPDVLMFSQNRDGWDGRWKKKWEGMEGFITEALKVYLLNLGIDPFTGVSK